MISSRRWRTERFTFVYTNRQYAVMLIAGFDWDDGNWPKCAKHGLAQDEIEYALRHEPAVFPGGTADALETRFSAIGRNSDGRFLFVVFTFRRLQKEIRLRPISARYMHEKEIARYEQDRKS